MALWPRDDRTKKTPPIRNNGLVKDQNRNYPYIEPGLVGATTLLEEEDKRFQWAFLNIPSRKAADSRRLNFGKSIDVFPPTRSIPVRRDSGSIRQQAEQGANFLRMFLPDVEIASSLIRDQLAEEAVLCRELERFDPYSGNLLDFFGPYGNSNSGLLFFPAGETNTHLNVSSIDSSEDRKLDFKSSAKPVYIFPTPIRQIIAFEHQDINLSVRTYSTTHFFSLKMSSEMSENILVEELASLKSADTANDAIVDVNLLPCSEGPLLVSDSGTVWRCQLGDGRKEVNPVYESYLSSAPVDHEFWRLSTGASPHVYSVMSSEKVWQHDIRTNRAQEVLSILGGKHYLTSIAEYDRDHTFCLSSTSHAIWMDRRFPNRPLLAYAHGREYDRYLVVDTLPCTSSSPFTILTTRNNSLTTVYDVSRTSEGLIMLDSLPYVLSTDAGVYRRHVGQKFIVAGKTLGLARLSELGNIEYTGLALDANSQKQYAIDCWAPKVHELTAASGYSGTDVVQRGLREFAQVNIRPIYDAIFRQYHEEAKHIEEEKAEATYRLVDHFPSYIQIKEPPTDHMLTAYDIAFRAGDEPICTSRADFFADTLINSKRGYRALRQGRLSPQLVKAPFHRSILSTLRKLDKHFPVDIEQCVAYVQAFNLVDTEGRPGTCHRYELEACEQLTLDLALSGDIFSDTPISRLGQALEVMAEALTLGNEPPPIEFGFLKPRRKFFFAEGEVKSDSSKLPIGVRLLLKEWDTSDVADYRYRDPYDVLTSVEALRTVSAGLANQRRHVKSESQRPPQIMASTAAIQVPNDVPRTPVGQIQSQEYFHSRMTGIASAPLGDPSTGLSQELNVSTQILPGPHGGRPQVKKKTIKKRLGGF